MESNLESNLSLKPIRTVIIRHLKILKYCARITKPGINQGDSLRSDIFLKRQLLKFYGSNVRPGYVPAYSPVEIVAAYLLHSAMPL